MTRPDILSAQEAEAEAALHITMRLRDYDQAARARILVMAAINLDLVHAEQLIEWLGTGLRNTRKKPGGAL
jgi:hypothetical protein